MIRDAILQLIIRVRRVPLDPRLEQKLNILLHAHVGRLQRHRKEGEGAGTSIHTDSAARSQLDCFLTAWSWNPYKTSAAGAVSNRRCGDVSAVDNRRKEARSWSWRYTSRG
jgi:hypothetical protein